MPTIRIKAVPYTSIDARPEWVGQAMVGITMPIAIERCMKGWYAVTPQAIIDGLLAKGEANAANWWQEYFRGMEGEDYMLFRIADCEYLP